MINGHRSN